MGLSTKKQSTTQTPIVNEPMNTNLNTLAGKDAAFLNSDPSQYVAPASPLQEQAFAGVQDLGGWQAPSQQALGMARSAGGAGASTYQPPRLGAANQAAGVNIAAAPQAQAQSLLTNLQSYINPYTDRVVDSTLANYDDYSGQQAAAMAARGGASGAFAGSRYGIAEGQFEADRGRNRAATEYGIRSDAFNTGAMLSGQDADRRQNTNFFNIGNTQQRNMAQAGLDSTRSMFNVGQQNQYDLAQGGMDAQAAQYNAQAGEAALQRAMQAAGLTANIGADMGAQSRADLGLTADLGEYQRMIQQAKLNAVPTQLQIASGLFNAIPQASYIGQKGVTKSTGSLFDQALAAASVAAQFSDRRLKLNIAKTGELADGLGVYEWEYRQDAGIELPKGRFRGVMADEVAALRPWALGPVTYGFATVAYNRLGA